jgi:hypothetical protein
MAIKKCFEVKKFLIIIVQAYGNETYFLTSIIIEILILTIENYLDCIIFLLILRLISFKV